MGDQNQAPTPPVEGEAAQEARAGAQEAGESALESVEPQPEDQEFADPQDSMPEEYDTDGKFVTNEDQDLEYYEPNIGNIHKKEISRLTNIRVMPKDMPDRPVLEPLIVKPRDFIKTDRPAKRTRTGYKIYPSLMDVQADPVIVKSRLSGTKLYAEREKYYPESVDFSDMRRRNKKLSITGIKAVIRNISHEHFPLMKLVGFESENQLSSWMMGIISAESDWESDAGGFLDDDIGGWFMILPKNLISPQGQRLTPYETKDRIDPVAVLHLQMMRMLYAGLVYQEKNSKNIFNAEKRLASLGYYDPASLNRRNDNSGIYMAKTVIYSVFYERHLFDGVKWTDKTKNHDIRENAPFILENYLKPKARPAGPK